MTKIMFLFCKDKANCSLLIKKAVISRFFIIIIKYIMQILHISSVTAIPITTVIENK